MIPNTTSSTMCQMQLSGTDNCVVGGGGEERREEKRREEKRRERFS